MDIHCKVEITADYEDQLQDYDKSDIITDLKVEEPEIQGIQLYPDLKVEAPGSQDFQLYPDLKVEAPESQDFQLYPKLDEPETMGIKREEPDVRSWCEQDQNEIVPPFDTVINQTQIPTFTMNLKDDPKTVYRCNECTFQTKKKSNFDKHIVQHEKIEGKRKPTTGNAYKCGGCSFETSKKLYLNRHLQRHKKVIEGKMLKCLECEFETVDKSTLKRHQIRHKKYGSSQKPTELINLGGCEQNLFNLDLVKFMVGCNISWNQLDNPLFREFVEKCVGGEYSEVQLPKSTTLRTTYLPQLAENVVSNICSQLEGKYIWVCVDEITNACGAKVANVLVGALEELSSIRPYLLASKILDSTNANTISNLIHDSLRLLWGDRYDTNKDKFILFLTDSAAYMIAAGRILQQTYAVLHVTCLAHALHRVAELVRECYPNVDMLMTSIKKVFLKAPGPLQLFSEMLPGIRLPPQPDIARSGTWIEAIYYYTVHFEDVKRVVERLQPCQGVEIENAQRAVKDPTVYKSLQEIQIFYSRIPLAIQQLQWKPHTDNFCLVDAMNVLNDLRQYISLATCETAQRIQQKLQTVLNLNPDFRTLCSIEKLLRNQEVNFAAPDVNESSLRNYLLFKYAPMTSLNIEHTFSVYKWIFSDKRRSFSPLHLEQILIIYIYYYMNTPSD